MDVSQSTQAVAKGLSEIRVPIGHITVSDRWRNTDLVTSLQGSVRVLYDDNLGVVDFHPSSQTGVIYVSEGDIASGTAYKRKVAKLRKANKVRGVVIAEKTPTTSQYYQDLQKFVMLEIGFALLPVANQKEAAGLLSQMVEVEGRPDKNPFLKKARSVTIDTALMTTLQTVPKLGEVKAKQLLMHFGSIQSIVTASVEELTKVVGKAGAQNLRSFFDGR